MAAKKNPNPLTELRKLVVNLWNAGTRWTRWALGLVVGWPFVLALAALTGSAFLVSLLALMPIIAALILLLVYFSPLGLGLVAVFRRGREALRILSTIVGIEIGTGIYFVLAQAHNDPWLIPVVATAAFGVLFLMMGVPGTWRRYTVQVLVAIIVIVTIIWQLGGREKVKEKVEDFWKSGPGPAAAAPRGERPAYERLEDGTFALNPGAKFTVGGTEPITFLIQPEGFYLIDGRVKISSPVLFTLVSGERTRDFKLDAERHARQYGGPPCFKDVNPFKISVISTVGQSALLRARLPGEKCN